MIFIKIIITWFCELLTSNDAIKIRKKLYRLTIDALNIFALRFENLYLFFNDKYNSWWRCLVSGKIGDWLNLNFLIIEKRISKHGYQTKVII